MGFQPIAQKQYISIYNLLGIEVIKINEDDLSGKNSINISTANLTSGNYFCSYNNGLERITKSFLVIK